MRHGLLLCRVKRILIWESNRFGNSCWIFESWNQRIRKWQSNRQINVELDWMEQLESVQYSAALAVTGAWKGTSREKLYNELGLESLNLRRWSRRLVMFHKIVNNITPEYTRHPIPQLEQSMYSLCEQNVVGQIRARTERFKIYFYPNCLIECNKLLPEVRHLR